MRKSVFILAAAVAVLIATVLFPGRQQELAVHEEFFNYTVHFCPEENCIQIISQHLSSSGSFVECAFYTADQSIIGNISGSKARVELVFNEGAKALRSIINLSNILVYTANSKGIMHNKYCIIDNSTIITGSFNPTAAAKNDRNNILIINSTALSMFYSEDFSRLKNSSQRRKSIAEKAVVLNTTRVNAYFCPYDDCAAAVKRELGKANKTIVFAAYSFTNAGIANELILKSSEGVAVTGVIEKSTAKSQYSKYNSLAANGINVTASRSKGLMHNKFFVIDNLTVITGSFNPTENADKRNDENIIVISNADVAKRYADNAQFLINFK